MPVQGPVKPELQTVTVRQFKGVNLTDARSAIADDEFAWLENLIPIGSGQVTVVPGPNDPVATLANFYPLVAAPAMFPVILNNQPAFVLVASTGAISHVTVPGGAVTVIAAAGTFTASAHIAVWRDTTVLIIDPTAGYYQWTPGGGLVLIDATRLGDALAVFEGRAWLKVANRTIDYTSPGTFNDFVVANGAGSVVISDEVFPGAIVHLLSALEQLWIIGPGAVNAISNVQTVAGPPVLTTFSITNIVSNVGTSYASSVSSFFRTFLFQTPYGVYAIVGSTPQKLSDKLDGLYPFLDLDGGRNPAATTSIYNVFTWVTLAVYNDPRRGARPLLLCFAQGKWFFASDPDVGYIASVLVNSAPQLWGVKKSGTSAQLYRLFADDDEPVTYRLTTKLYDFGNSTQVKQMYRIGLETVAPFAIAPSIRTDNEVLSVGQPMLFTGGPGALIFVGVGPITFVGTGPITFIGQPSGLTLGRAGAQITGRYLGVDVTGTEKAWSLQAIIMQVAAGMEWTA